MFVFMHSVYHGDFRAPAIALARSRKRVLLHFVARKSSTRESGPERQHRALNAPVEEEARAKRSRTANTRSKTSGFAKYFCEADAATPTFIRSGTDRSKPLRERRGDAVWPGRFVVRDGLTTPIPP